MSDYREVLVRSIEESLLTILSPDTIKNVSDRIICILNDYEVTKKCTDIVPYNDSNERILKRYCACLKIDGKSDKTIYCYSKTIKRFLESIGRPIREVGVYDIRFFLATEKERGVSNRTLENTRSHISPFFQWLANEEIIQKNPCANIKPIKYTDKQRLPFSAVELDNLRHACNNQMERSLIEALLTSGVRVSELVDLEIDDIDFQTLSVHVKHGKGDKERITYINDVAKSHLQKYLMDRPDVFTALFVSRYGTKYTTNYIRELLKTIGKRANVTNVHPHRFRRTFATNLAIRGMAVQDIQKLLGHTNIATTMEYVYTSDITVKASYNKYIA